MNIRRISIAIVVFAGALCILTAQTSATMDVLNKKDLKSIQQNIGKQAGSVKQAAAAVLQKMEVRIPLRSDLPDSDEIALGRETAGRLCAAAPVVNNDSLERYINLVGRWVASRSPRANLPWTFGVIASEDINAFSLPGGYVFITAGLYKALKNEAELAAIFGHEIAHVNLRHQVRLMQQERLLAQGSDFLAGKTRQEALKALCGQGAAVCARSLDKNAEYEADCIGLYYAVSAGYDPFAYVDLLDRIGASNQADRLALLFKTHPHPADRLAALEKKIGLSWPAVTGIIPDRWVSLP